MTNFGKIQNAFNEVQSGIMELTAKAKDRTYGLVADSIGIHQKAMTSISSNPLNPAKAAAVYLAGGLEMANKSLTNLVEFNKGLVQKVDEFATSGPKPKK